MQIGVVGAGTMGAGVAQAAAVGGCEVVLYDIADDVVTRALLAVAQDLQRAVDRGRYARAEADAALARIHPARALEALRPCALVVEAVVERLETKQALFGDLDALLPAPVVLATNTSSLSVTAIASAARRPERVLGLHFFNPVPRMKLVELVRGRRTDAATVETATTFVRAMDKQLVICADAPAFIVNRVARNFYGEALRILDEGGASVEQIDRVMHGAGFPMGPFELMDLIGIDVNLAVTESVYEQFYHDPRFRPHPIQRRMVQACLLGRKTGRGFYAYPEGARGARSSA